MFDFSLNNILHSNVINFAIMIAVFAFIINKLNVAQKIEDMRASIQKSVEEAEAIKEEAKQDYENIAESVSNIEEEIKNIEEKAESTAQAFEAKSKDDIEKSVETIKKNIEKQIVSEENHVQADLMKKVSESSIEIAQRQIKSALDKDQALHRKYIDEFIDSIDEMEV